MNILPIHRLGLFLSGHVERWMPNPFVFGLVLTYLVFIGGLVVEGRTAGEMLTYWNDGFWGLLEFSMQMVLIIGTGYVLAFHPRVQQGLDWLARFPSNGAQAAVLVGAVSMTAAWFHWGISLVLGAVFARELGFRLQDRGIPAHYPLLCVAGYMGLGLTWHWGLSGSAPLLMNTPNNLFVGRGLVDGVLSPSATIFHPYTLILLVVTMAGALGILHELSPPAARAKPITEYVDQNDRQPERHSKEVSTAFTSGSDESSPGTPADQIDGSRIIGGLVALGGIVLVVRAFATQGLGALRINVLNFGLLFIGLVLYRYPDVYQHEFYDAVRSSAGIVLLFPFYAGIIGMMNLSGLSTTLTASLLGYATSETFPVIAWLSAGLLNVFVPSGGAQWNLMGVELLSRGRELGVAPGKTVIAFGAGDAYTNLIQPFWAIPLLGITGIRARELFGYAITVMLLLAPVLGLALFFIPY